MHGTEQRHKRTFGMSAYVATAVGLAARPVRSMVRVETEAEVVESAAVMVLVANCGQLIPGVLWLSTSAAPDDGVFDVAILDASDLAGAARVAWRLLVRRPEGAGGVRLLRARRVSISAEPALPVQADGEAAGRTPFAVELVPGALHVLAPRHG
jgi:diacylglycerol kinase family enzyme